LENKLEKKNENQGKPETIGNKYKEYYKTVKNENHAKKILDSNVRSIPAKIIEKKSNISKKKKSEEKIQKLEKKKKKSIDKKKLKKKKSSKEKKKKENCLLELQVNKKNLIFWVIYHIIWNSIYLQNRCQHLLPV